VRGVVALLCTVVFGCARVPPPAESATKPAPARERPTAPLSERERWIEKLAQGTETKQALERLLELFGEALIDSEGDRKRDPAKAFIEASVDPLSRIYVERYAELEPRARVNLLALLGAFFHPRSEPALRKAFEEFVENPNLGRDDLDIKWASLSNAVLRLPSLDAPMLAAFLEFDTSSRLGGYLYRDLNYAMLRVRSPTWVEPLIASLRAPMTPPRLTDTEVTNDFRNQLFWQTTAAEVLGRIGDRRAIPALLDLVLNKQKADVHATALYALTRLGKPAREAAAGLLSRGLEERKAAALVLTFAGQSDGLPALLAALAKERDDVTRAVIARDLPKIRSTPESVAAFERTFESLPAKLEIGSGGSALPILAGAAGQFFEPAMVEWLLARLPKYRGKAHEALRASLVMTAIKLASPAQLAAVKAAALRHAGPKEQDALLEAEALLSECGELAACYVSVLADPRSQTAHGEFIGIKAAYQAVMLGNASTRDRIIEKLPAITSPISRHLAAVAIERLTPQGGEAEVIAKLAPILDLDPEAAPVARYNNAALQQVVARLEGRAR
jgi:hypothetical protein